MIFAGPDGVGRFTTAKAWAKLLLCHNPAGTAGTADSCGICKSCLAVDGGSHPDFNHIYKELNKISRDPALRGRSAVKLPIEVMREFFIEKVASKPLLSSRSVWIISESEKLSVEAQNALLKVFEEPPGFCHIILLCTRLDQLLPTTLSRCQIVRFGPVERQKIIAAVVAAGRTESEAAFWAGFTGGSLGAALQCSDVSTEKVSAYHIKQEIIKQLSRYSLSEAIDFAAELSEKCKSLTEYFAGLERDTGKSDINRRSQAFIINLICSAVSDAMKFAIAPDEIIHNDQKDCIERLAGRLDAETAARLVEKCYESARWIEDSVNEKLLFEQLLISIAKPDMMPVL